MSLVSGLIHKLCIWRKWKLRYWLHKRNMYNVVGIQMW